MARLIIHIGLPKTATTALQQDVFESTANSRRIYLGVLQPRDQRRQPSGYGELYDAICRGEQLEHAKRFLIDKLGRNELKKLVFSEEMIVVSQGANTWRRKLFNLSNLISRVDYQLVVTVREPAAALFSYYTELYPQLLKDRISFQHFARKDERAEIFHYGKLFGELERLFGFDRVTVVKFEDLINKNLSSVFDLLEMDDTERQKIQIHVRNSRQHRADGVLLEKPRSLLSPMRAMLTAVGLKGFSFRKKLPALLPMVDLLKRVSLPKRRYLVPKPAKGELEKLRRDLSGQTEAAYSLFGIDYRPQG